MGREFRPTPVKKKKKRKKRPLPLLDEKVRGPCFFGSPKKKKESLIWLGLQKGVSRRKKKKKKGDCPSCVDEHHDLQEKRDP